jgi:hypothetical protein
MKSEIRETVAKVERPGIFGTPISLSMNLNGKFPLTPTPLPKERGTSPGPRLHCVHGRNARTNASMGAARRGQWQRAKALCVSAQEIAPLRKRLKSVVRTKTDVAAAESGAAAHALQNASRAFGRQTTWVPQQTLTMRLGGSDAPRSHVCFSPLWKVRPVCSSPGFSQIVLSGRPQPG